MIPLILAGINLAAGAVSNRRGKQRDKRAQMERMAQAAPLQRRAAVLRTGASRQGLTNLSYMANRALLAGREGDRQEALGQNSADVASAAGRSPTSLPGVYDRAMTRARGLSRLARYTSDDFDNNLMRERVAAVGGGRQRQSVGLQGVLDSVGLRAGTLAAGQASREMGAMDRENMFGTLVGLGVSAAPDIQAWNQRRRAMNASEYGAGGIPSLDTRGLG